MATITADTFLDVGTARTAGEAWTMNGGVLTVRTDTPEQFMDDLKKYGYIRG